MKPPVKLPGVSKRAAAMIRQLMSEFYEMDQGEHMPSIVWAIDLVDDEEEVAAPAVGVSKIGDIPNEYIVEAHGLTLAFLLPVEIEEKFKDSILDFVHGNFVFVHPGVATWLDR
jgi:hypothetical protein